MKHRIPTFFAGLLFGATLFGGATAIAASQAVQAVQTSPAENVRISCYKEGPLAAGDGTGLIIYPSGAEYTVTSSDPSIVSVEKAMGQFWKANAISPATAKITATGPDGQTGSVTVMVTGSVQSEAPSVDLSAKGLYTTNDHGEIHITGIVGTVVIKETRPLPGYTIEPGRESQTITVNPQETQTATFYNIPANTLTLEKYLETESGTEPLKGVTSW